MTFEVIHTARERFEAKFIPEPNSGCWLWIGAVSKNDGYGRFRGRNKVRYLAHRFAYEEYRGPIPEGLSIDHLCRVRCCVNPDHLEAVSIRTNILRAPTTLAGINARKTHCKWGHPFDEENTRLKPDGKRKCRACERRARKAAMCS